MGRLGAGRGVMKWAGRGGPGGGANQVGARSTWFEQSPRGNTRHQIQ